jgi:hypothetical protein
LQKGVYHSSILIGEDQALTGRRKKLVLLSVLIGIGLVSLYVEARQFLPPWSAELFPPLFLAGIFGLEKILTKPTPTQTGAAAVGRAVSYWDIAKSAACMIVALVWVVIAMRRVSDSPGGAALILLPSFVILSGSAYFFWRGTQGGSGS